MIIQVNSFKYWEGWATVKEVEMGAQGMVELQMAKWVRWI